MMEEGRVGREGGGGGQKASSLVSEQAVEYYNRCQPFSQNNLFCFVVVFCKRQPHIPSRKKLAPKHKAENLTLQLLFNRVEFSKGSSQV